MSVLSQIYRPAALLTPSRSSLTLNYQRWRDLEFQAEKFERSDADIEIISTISPSPTHITSNFPANPSKLEYKGSPYRVLVLDSSFNPPTRAHQHLLLSAVEQGLRAGQPFDACLLLLATQNADKKRSGAGLGDRLAMMEIMAGEIADELEKSQRNEKTCVEIGIGLTRFARFIDKARALTSSSSQQDQSIEPWFIVGFDTAIRLFNPRYYHDMHAELAPFFKSSQIFCANRAGFEENEVQAFFQSKEVKAVRSRVHPLTIHEELALLSSTRARELVQDVLPKEERIEKLRAILPGPVARYVVERELYL
ncbi:uncharacterized protein VTP21DRAFT_9821 [Calcarisporiella thermophila]|uniref:uncharacterized protein n=1 Tax=Calcarisporiella thermophila TaxID=911321 RepID=UPI003743FF10